MVKPNDFNLLRYNCALENVFCQATRSCDMSITMLSHCKYDVFVLTDVSRDYLSYFIIDNMVCVCDVQDFMVVFHIYSLYSLL